MKEQLQDIIARKREFKVIGSYGIKYLDDYLLGIIQEDFILIGSSSGQGKTELAYEMAFINAQKGLNVHLFALEADMDEPYNRRIYKKVSRMYFDDVRDGKRSNFVHMSYRNFITNQYDLKEYEDIAVAELAEESKSLSVHYRGNEFTIETLLRTVKEIEGKCDLLILDHVDYFDLDARENENSQMTQIMKCLRDINQVYRLPIVVISHMRKKGSHKQLLYNLDDFMGSSNKAKQAKTVVILSRDFERDDYSNLTYGTFVSVPKTRIGSGGNLIGRVLFDARINKYENGYLICKLTKGGESIEDLGALSYPHWATLGGMNNEMQVV